MKCPRCHNTNVNRFYKINNEIYCRDCIKFNKVNISKERKTYRKKYITNTVKYNLDFTLSNTQQDIARKLVDNYRQQKNSLVLAVCGSGKTEIVFEVITYALNNGDRVCFCVPRSEIVKELYERIKASFTNVDIGLIIGGKKENEQAQLIICTMHQLYRFENNVGFDLMIADEVDAFPFYNNRVLNEIFKRCTLKCYIKLSATFIKKDIKDEQLLIMNRRYHGKDLPLPKLIIIPNIFHKKLLLYLIQSINKRILVFVPYITQVEEICQYLNQHHILSLGVHSNSKLIQENLKKLKNNEVNVIVTTTLLERGITIEDVQVIVYQAHNQIFDKKTLIQIAGRVGRKPQYSFGKVYFISDRKTRGISGCIKEIKKLNTMNV